MIDIPKVMLRSVLGTTFMWLKPMGSASVDIRSTGSQSIELNSSTQQKIVSASGAISLLLPW